MDYHKDFVTPLFMGEFDEYLDGMIHTINEYKKSKAPKIWEFQIGERVRFNDGTRPKYLQGVEGTVKKINRTKIVVDLDERKERFFKNITVPLTLVEKVN